MTGKGCLKVGCFSCLGVLAVAALGLVVVLVAGGVLSGRSEKRIEDVERSQDLPAPRGGIPPGPGEVEAPLIPTFAGGRVVLDVSMVSFEIVPGDPGKPVRVEGRYDTSRYALKEAMDHDDGEGWTYHLGFRRRGLSPLFNQNDDQNRLKLIVPRGVPVVIEGSIGIGESILELGGLSLVRLDLDLGIGEHDISFSVPLQAAMERVRLQASIGELRIVSLGNASPRAVDVRHRMGEVDLDLRGKWTTDANIELHCGIGECHVRLPADIAVAIDRADVMIGETSLPDEAPVPPPAPGAPALRLSVSGSLGDVSIDR